MLETAKRLLEQGLSVIPVRSDKKPALKWKPFQDVAMTVSQAAHYFGHAPAIALVCGFDGVEAIDFDAYDPDSHAVTPFEIDKVFHDWLEHIRTFTDIDAFAVQKTPSGGYHVVYRLAEGCFEGNQKLATIPANNKAGYTTVIETRAQGGYICLEPSAGYVMLQGDMADLPVIDAKTRHRLLEAARAFHCEVACDDVATTPASTPQPSPAATASKGNPARDSVIAAFNERHTVADILTRNSYKRQGDKFVAPDSSSGNAGVSLLEGGRYAYSHHGSDVLSDGYKHDAFDCFALLEHAGDKKAAAKAARTHLDPIRHTSDPSRNANASPPATANASPSQSTNTSPATATKPTSKGKPTKQTNEGNQTQQLLALVRATDADFFHTPNRTPYLTVTLGRRRETLKLDSREVRLWLGGLFFEAHNKPPSSDALRDGLEHLKGVALYKSACREVHVRLAKHDGCIFLDLANDAGEVVCVDADDWTVTRTCPVAFVRPNGMAALPTPEQGGSMFDLQAFVAVSDGDFALLVAFLVMCLNPDGAYPLLLLLAEQGSGKSTVAKIIKTLIDPNSAPVRRPPKTTEDLMIAAQHNRLLVYDNLSRMSQDLSDDLCTLATEGAISQRKKYTDDEESILHARRPVVLTAINDIATQSDLLDRAVILRLPRIDEGQRQTERAFWEGFHLIHAGVLGALLTGVSHGLANQDAVQLDNLPRMADFAEWFTACEGAFGYAAGNTLRAYEGNRQDVHGIVLEGNLVADGIQVLCDKNGGVWQGTTSQLLKALQDITDSDSQRLRVFPKTAAMLGRAVNAIRPNLRATGIDVQDVSLGRGNDRRKAYRIVKRDSQPA